MDIKREDIEVMISADQLRQRIQELGATIASDYAGRDLHVVAVLKGSFMFLADLVREIELDFTIDFLGLSSYGDSTVTSGVVRVTQDLSTPIAGRDVLFVEDIVDTGLTLKYLYDNFATRNPASVKVCTLLHKPSNHSSSLEMDYIGFTIPDRFVIGYGLDYAEKFRNLPFVGAVRPGN